MANKSPNGNNQTFVLDFGAQRKASGVPYLSPFFSYLLKLSPNVGLVEIYPWLAELMFKSIAREVDGTLKKLNSRGSGGNVWDKKLDKPVNVVSFFVDDHKDNIANIMLKREKRLKVADPFAAYCLECRSEDSYRPRNIIVDTFGRFSDNQNEYMEISKPKNNEDNSPAYVQSSLVGAGNPMRMMQRFTAIGNMDRIPPTESSGSNRESLELGEMNCFLINSISNLYRTMGFRDAMLLVRAILERGVWKPQGSLGDGTLLDKEGMLLAILNDEVFSKDEIRYAETFFDGVIRFQGWIPEKTEIMSADGKTEFKKYEKYIAYWIERFPIVDKSLLDAIGDNSKQNPFCPEYDFAYVYEPRSGSPMEAIRVARSDITYGAQNCDGA